MFLCVCSKLSKISSIGLAVDGLLTLRKQLVCFLKVSTLHLHKLSTPLSPGSFTFRFYIHPWKDLYFCCFCYLVLFYTLILLSWFFLLFNFHLFYFIPNISCIPLNTTNLHVPLVSAVTVFLSLWPFTTITVSATSLCRISSRTR